MYIYKSIYYIKPLKYKKKYHNKYLYFINFYLLFLHVSILNNNNKYIHFQHNMGNNCEVDIQHLQP